MSTLLPVRFSQAACLNKFGLFASLTMATTLAMAMRASQWFSGPFNDLFLSGVHNWIVFARKMHSTTKFAMTILSKSHSVCVCECVRSWCQAPGLRPSHRLANLATGSVGKALKINETSRFVELLQVIQAS